MLCFFCNDKQLACISVRAVVSSEPSLLYASEIIPFYDICEPFVDYVANQLVGTIEQDDREEVRRFVRGGASLVEQRDHTARLLLCHFRAVLGVEDGVYPSSEDFLFLHLTLP